MATVIPQNASTTKTTRLGRVYLLYTCPECGEMGLSEHALRRAETRSLASSAAADPARAETAEDLIRRLKEGDFSGITEKVLCARCSKRLPWSGMGKPWPRTWLAIVTGALAAANLIWLRANALAFRTGDGRVLAGLLPLGAMVLVSLGYVLLRRSRLAALRDRPRDWPEVRTAKELERLTEGPWRALAAPVLEKARREAAGGETSRPRHMFEDYAPGSEEERKNRRRQNALMLGIVILLFLLLIGALIFQRSHVFHIFAD